MSKLIAVSLILLALTAESCSHSPYLIVFIFPTNFRGTAKILGNRPLGIRPDRVESKITLKFPESGILEIQDELPTLKWHSTVAMYESGEKFPTDADADPNAIPDDNQIALRSAGVKGNSEDWFVVGTKADLKHTMDEKRGFKFSPEK